MKTADSKQPMNPAAAETKEKLYDRWVNEVCDFLKEVGPKLDRCCSAMQSRPVLDKSPEVVFLGYNAHESDSFYIVSSTEIRLFTRATEKIGCHGRFGLNLITRWNISVLLVRWRMAIMYL